jgi:hypothetical protein
VAALGTDKETGKVIAAFVRESDPGALAAMIDAAGALGGSEAGPFLRDLMLAADTGPTFEPLGPAALVVQPAFAERATPLRLLGPPMARLDAYAAEARFDRAALRALAVRASARADRLEPVAPLVALVGGSDRDLALEAAEALSFITNHRILASDETKPLDQRLGEAYVAFDKLHKQLEKMPRDAWLVHGFYAGGYKVPALDRRALWELLRAVDRQAHHSYNARRVLSRILGEPDASVGWHAGEACRHFQRALFDRRAELGIGAPSDAQRAACLAPRD